jgi:hypothetical protein
VALDAAEFRVRKALIPETGDEDPLDCARFPGELTACGFFGRRLESLLDRISIVDEWLEHLWEIAILGTDTVAQARDVLSVRVTVTADRFWGDVPSTHDVGIETREIQLVDVLVESHFGGEREPATVGQVQGSSTLEVLRAPRSPGHEDVFSHRFPDLNRGEDVPDTRPAGLLEGLVRPPSQIQEPVEI